MRNHLNKLLVAGMCCLSGVGLTGCNGARHLGFVDKRSAASGEVDMRYDSFDNQKKNNLLKSERSTDDKAVEAVKDVSKVKNNRSIADASVDIAGSVGEVGMGVLGGMVGGSAGAVYGGISGAVCNHDAIVESIKNGASGGAYYASAFTAPIGKYAARMVTYGVIWGTPYVFNGVKWLASNAYSGIKYTAASMYNGAVSFNERLSTELKDFSKKATCQGLGNVKEKLD